MVGSEQQSKRAIQVSVRGDVQGVGLRYRCQWQAEHQDLAGWAHNEADGTVSIYLEGAGYRIDNFLAWLRGGVDGVQISRIDIHPVDPKGINTFSLG